MNGRARRRRVPEPELRVHAVMAALIMLGIAAWSLSASGPMRAFTRPAFADLAQFLAGAKMLADDQVVVLYQPERFLEVVKAVVPWPQPTIYPPVYPVHVYAVFLLVAHLPFHWAVLAFSVGSLAAYATGVYLIGRPSGVPLTLGLLAAGNPALLRTVMAGQLSTVSFMQLALAWWVWRRRRLFLTGLVLGSFMWKPPLLLFGTTLLLMRPTWALAAGLATGISAQVAIVALIWGPHAWADYARVLRLVAKHPGIFSSPHHFQSIKGALGLVLAPGPLLTGLWVCISVAVLALAWQIGRRTLDERVAFAAMVVVGLLVSPHVYAYDALLYGVALLLVGQAALERGHFRRSDLVGYTLHWGPVLLPLAAVTRVQWSTVLGIAWLAFSLMEMEPSSGSEPPDDKPTLRM